MKFSILLFFLFGFLHSALPVQAEVLYRSQQQPQLLSVALGDSDLVIKSGKQFSISYRKEISGAINIGESERKALLDKVKVSFNSSSGDLKVESPKILVGRVFAQIEIEIYQPLGLYLVGADGDLNIQNVSLAKTSIRLEDGDIECHQTRFLSDTMLETQDGDIQIYHPSSLRQIELKSSGDGKIRQHSVYTDESGSGSLLIKTEDGDITVF